MVPRDFTTGRRRISEEGAANYHGGNSRQAKRANNCWCMGRNKLGCSWTKHILLFHKMKIFLISRLFLSHNPLPFPFIQCTQLGRIKSLPFKILVLSFLAIDGNRRQVVACFGAFVCVSNWKIPFFKGKARANHLTTVKGPVRAKNSLFRIA